MIKFEVKTNEVRDIKWTDKKTGEQRVMRVQTMLAYMPNSKGEFDGTYDKIEHIIGDKQSPLPIGTYTLTPQCFYLDRNNRLNVGLSNLTPVNVAAKIAA